MTANVAVHSTLDDEQLNHFRLPADSCLNEQHFQPMPTERQLNSYFLFAVNDSDVDFQGASHYGDAAVKSDSNPMEYVVAVEQKRLMRLGYGLSFGDFPSHVAQLLVAYYCYSIAIAEHSFVLGPNSEPCQTNASNYSDVKPCASYSDGKLSHYYDVDVDLRLMNAEHFVHLNAHRVHHDCVNHLIRGHFVDCYVC